MSPLKVTLGLSGQELGPHRDSLHITAVDLSVHWHGDDEGKAVLVLPGGGTVEFDLKTLGSKAGYEIPVTIAPVEAGEPTTSVRWHLGLERI